MSQTTQAFNDSRVSEAELRRLRERRRFSDAEVTFIRESYLLEKRRLREIRDELDYSVSTNMLWQIAVGRAYKHVALSARLIEALSAPRQNTKAAAVEVAAANRVDELLSAEPEELEEPAWA